MDGDEPEGERAPLITCAAIGRRRRRASSGVVAGPAGEKPSPVTTGAAAHARRVGPNKTSHLFSRQGSLLQRVVRQVTCGATGLWSHVSVGCLPAGSATAPVCVGRRKGVEASRGRRRFQPQVAAYDDWSIRARAYHHPGLAPGAASGGGPRVSDGEGDGWTATRVAG